MRFSIGLRQIGHSCMRSPHIWQVPCPHRKIMFFRRSIQTGQHVYSISKQVITRNLSSHIIMHIYASSTLHNHVTLTFEYVCIKYSFFFYSVDTHTHTQARTHAHTHTHSHGCHWSPYPRLGYTSVGNDSCLLAVFAARIMSDRFQLFLDTWWDMTTETWKTRWNKNVNKDCLWSNWNCVTIYSTKDDVSVKLT